MTRSTLLFLAMLAAVLTMGPPAEVRADAVEDFYKGKTVRIVDGYPPGGGYSLYANLIVRHLSKHLPGHPTVIYQSMPGAGSLTLTNHLYNKAERDGTVIAAVSSSAAFAPLLGNSEARFDANQFNWLPAPSTETGLLVTWAASGIKSLDDATQRDVFTGVSSQNGTSAFYGRILNDVFKTRLKLIVGYPQMNDSLLAMERGEVHAFPSAFWSSLKANRPDWLKEKKLNLVLQYGLKPHPELKGVPVARELAKNEEDRQLLDASMASLVLGRPYMLPPEVPAERVAAMRKAFMETFADPEYQAEAARQNIDIDAEPKTGEDVTKVIADTYKAPKQVVDRLKRLFEASADK